MKKIVIGLISFIWCMNACAPETQSVPIPLIDASTATPTPTATQTSLPTQTPTASITPLPTIPTFTPTFDVSTIVTVTPALKAECTKEDQNLVPSFPIRTQENFYFENDAQILQYLNQGGKLDKATKRLALSTPVQGDTLFKEDVTGDELADLVFIDYEGEPRLHVFLCDSGQYQNVLPDIRDDLTGYSTAIQGTVNDLNRNGVPDILLRTRCSRHLGCTSLFILEWNGSEFINLIEPREIFEGFADMKTEDVNNDGILEVIINDDVTGDYAYFIGFPWRVSTHIYMWNGNQYALQNIQYTEPEYQFQAIQDADRYVILKNYGLSMKLYVRAITDNTLLPYSRELSEHMEWLFWNPMSIASATQPSPDTTEYPRLAAYVYYRMMLVHIVQGHESDATPIYNILQEKFGSDQYGSPYVEMATVFWEAYQSTQKIYDGCAASIQYAAEHREILVPLGSDYHGAQSKIYKPEDVCPFR